MATYEVGKGRPPRHTRWKPGQSGNPRGRPKSGTHFHQLLVDELSKIALVKVNGTLKKFSKAELIAHQLTRAALKGDPAAVSFVFMREQYFPEEEVRPMEVSALSDAERRAHAEAIYRRMVKKS